MSCLSAIFTTLCLMKVLRCQCSLEQHFVSVHAQFSSPFLMCWKTDRGIAKHSAKEGKGRPREKVILFYHENRSFSKLKMIAPKTRFHCFDSHFIMERKYFVSVLP